MKKVISVFDGISCFMQVCKIQGFDDIQYIASEINKKSIIVSKSNFPSINHVGDVSNFSGCLEVDVDIIVGGSPCQGFSFAGRQLNFNDPRSKLFFEFERIIKEARPKYFLKNQYIPPNKICGCAMRGRYFDGKTKQVIEFGGDKANALTTVSKDSMVYDGKGVRRYTQKELERLQGLPDGYTNGSSYYEAQKMLGNGWTIPVINYIISQIKLG